MAGRCANLKPHVRVLEFLGGTGNGKTEIASVPADPRARRILIEGVGNTNSTLTERLMVFTTEYSDKMVIAVKHEENAFTRNRYTEVIAKSIAQVVKAFGKKAPSAAVDDEEELKDALRTQLYKKNNMKAILYLLDEEQIESFIQGVVSLYRDFNLRQYHFGIYNTVKNKMADIETKENSMKFLSAIQQEVERTMDMQGEDFKEALWTVWSTVNCNLTDVFFGHFDRRDCSEDGYYYKEIMLDSPDMRFIEAMFTANNIQAGQRPSLEVLCGEIVIYVPMNRIFSRFIEETPTASQVFRDRLNHIVFGTLDTRGLYHADNTDDENEDYCSDLLYKGDIDSIAMVVPLEGDTNEKKIGELYRSLLKSFSKQIPVFMIHNKLDLFISTLLKGSFDDPLSVDVFDEIERNEEEIRQSIEGRKCELNDDLRAAQVRAKKRLPIKSLVCYLKRDASFPAALVEEFNILETYKTMLVDVAKSLQNSAYKIKFAVHEGEIPAPDVNEARLVALVHNHIADRATAMKVFTPGMSDIALSLGKTPHGNAYNALRRRLKNGDGYTSNIDESYFYNCKSFAVNFTANLRNFASAAFVHTVVSQTLELTGVEHTQEADDMYLQKVESYVNSKELVSLLLFYEAIQDAETTAFSFGSKFQNFLHNSLRYFDVAEIDEAAYVKAVKRIVLEAANKALDLNVTLR